MYKIRNVTGGILPFDLEVGSIMLQAHGNRSMIDLDGLCSRKWINENQVLHTLIAKICIQVVHDSESGIAKHPSYPIIRNEVKDVVVPKPDKPTIIDFSKVSEDQDKLPIEDVFEDIIFELEDEDTVIDPVEVLEEEDKEVEKVLEEVVEEVVEEVEKVVEEDDKELEKRVLELEAETAVDPTVCTVCGRKFKSERGKKVHMRTHKD